ncbi:hypothetical protein BKA81DRAFT_376 [Phyllosticta paracitricarpa]
MSPSVRLSRSRLDPCIPLYTPPIAIFPARPQSHAPPLRASTYAEPLPLSLPFPSQPTSPLSRPDSRNQSTNATNPLSIPIYLSHPPIQTTLAACSTANRAPAAHATTPCHAMPSTVQCPFRLWPVVDAVPRYVLRTHVALTPSRPFGRLNRVTQREAVRCCSPHTRLLQ